MNLKNFFSIRTLTTKQKIIPPIIAILYAVWLVLFIGIRIEHYILISILLGLIYFHINTRKFLYSFMGFAISVVLYDSLRAFPNYHLGVHIQDLYEYEKFLFGISTPEGILTPNEWFKTRTTPLMDVLGGIFYGNWVNIPVLLGIYFFVKDRNLLLRFSYGFLFLNILAYTTWYLYSAAPPWYVELYGFVENFNIKGHAAGLAGFDNYFGGTYFQDLYGKNPKVFAAMPSLHAAFPPLCVLYGLKRLRIWVLLICVHMTGAWFFAVYLNHHYILDILVGAIYGIIAYFFIEYLIRIPRIGKLLSRYYEAVK
jgi:hypothetical protein